MVPIDSATFLGGGELFVSDYEIEGFVTIGMSALASHRLREWHGKTSSF